MVKETVNIKELLGQLETPVELSEKETERIGSIFDQLRSLMNEYEETVLTLPRDDAFTLTRRLLSNVDSAINGEVVAPGQQTQPEPILVDKVDFKALLDTLPPKVRVIADRLDCVKQFFTEDIGMDIVCQHCSKEEMLKCINLIDPTVIEPWDQELMAKRRRTGAEMDQP